jgi:hypothetical protein
MEHFVPIRKGDLIDILCGEPGLNAQDRLLFSQFAHLLDVRIHLAYHHQLNELTRLYANFDPDADTIPPLPLTAGARVRQMNELFLRFDELLERANFVRLRRAELLKALEARSSIGLNLLVDFDIFDRLEIYARGDVVLDRLKRGWRGWGRHERVPTPSYQRLAIIFRLRENVSFGNFVDTEDVYIKVFKDIPKLDLEMLLPGSTVQMSLIDRAKIVLPTISGIGMAFWKVLQGAVLVAAAGVYSAAALLGLVGGTLGYGVRSFYGYLRTKEKHQLNLTESLYYQNLDNNAGAIFRLLNEAEEQEHREALLGYYFLWRHAPPQGLTSAELDGGIEKFLATKVGREIDFEVGDSLDKLARLRLVEQRPGERYIARPLAKALAQLADGSEEPVALPKAA